MNNEKIINEALKGNEQAFQNIYTEYSGKVYALCYKYVKNSADAEDMTQETFIKAINNLDKLNNVNKFESWLLSIAKNCCKEFLRKKKPVVLKNENAKEYFSQIIDKDDSFNPEQKIIDNENSEIIQEILKTLPKEQQEAVILYYFEEKSIKEISQQTECTEHCIRGRIKLGRKRILKQMKSLARKDKFAYMGAFTAFGYLIRPTSSVAAKVTLGTILGKTTAVVTAVAVTGFGMFGLHNLYNLSEKEEQLNMPTQVKTKVGNNMIKYPMTAYDGHSPYFDIFVTLSIPNGWEAEIAEDKGWYIIGSQRFCDTNVPSYVSAMSFCDVYIARFDYDYDIMQAVDKFKEIYNFDYIKFKRMSDTLAGNYDDWKDENYSYFAVVDSLNNVKTDGSKYFAFLHAETVNSNEFDEETFLEIVKSIQYEYRLYYVTLNKELKPHDSDAELNLDQSNDYTYDYAINDIKGEALLSGTQLLHEPKITYVSDSVLRLSIQAGTGISTCRTTYCDVSSSNISEQFYSVLGEYKNYVLYVDYKDDEFKIIVQHIFNKNTFYQEYLLSDVYVAADPVISCDIDEDGLAEIVYLKGKEHNEVKIDIDIEELLENYESKPLVY